ncbi:MAG: CysB family HTH-type transcriptional regulator [Pseudomonadota bacterium]
MNFQQLRIVRETARRDFNLTEVANALYTSQSGVSRHIRDLEDELGVELYIRKGKRLLGFTAPGSELLPMVERILSEVGNIKQLADHFANTDEGRLVIATTHTQARYTLPDIIGRFRQEFPKVHLELLQGTPAEISALVVDGDADVAIATESLDSVPDLATFPFRSWSHAVVVPRGHPLTTADPLTLPALAAFPVITYHQGFTGRGRIDKAFEAAHLHPDIVLAALDADVIKTYVALGLGVGIIAEIAFDPARDGALSLLHCPALESDNVTVLAVRRGRFLRNFALRFVQMCAPAVSEAEVRAATIPNA